METISTFQLIDISLLSVSFSRNENDEKAKNEGEEIPVPAQLNWVSNYEEEHNILSTILKVSLGDNESPFSIHTEMGGKFKFEQAPSNDELETVKNINCPAIVFPYLREYISDLTKRAGFTPLYLPPFNFVEAHKQKKNESAE